MSAPGPEGGVTAHVSCSGGSRGSKPLQTGAESHGDKHVVPPQCGDNGREDVLQEVRCIPKKKSLLEMVTKNPCSCYF